MPLGDSVLRLMIAILVGLPMIMPSGICTCAFARCQSSHQSEENVGGNEGFHDDCSCRHDDEVPRNSTQHACKGHHQHGPNCHLPGCPASIPSTAASNKMVVSQQLPLSCGVAIAANLHETTLTRSASVPIGYLKARCCATPIHVCHCALLI